MEKRKHPKIDMTVRVYTADDFRGKDPAELARERNNVEEVAAQVCFQAGVLRKCLEKLGYYMTRDADVDEMILGTAEIDASTDGVLKKGEW